MDEFFEDNLADAWQSYDQERRSDLFHRFPGWYRGRVEETNDPLINRRVRVRVPELHDSNVKVEDIPWVNPAPWMGGKGSGSWTHPMIGDIVWVCFEKNHPYGPIWCATADPTRRRSYPHQSIYGVTPAPISDLNGRPEPPPEEVLTDFLPKDGRPYSTGFKDRYGSFFIMNSTGFFPVEHKNQPAPFGTDALGQREFRLSRLEPVKNDPDTKFIGINTKYGHLFLLADIGYDWEEEFTGDFEEDQDFEKRRSQYLQQFFNENSPTGRDQRRIDIRSRYGHKMEFRDVGFQKSRPDEYAEDPVEFAPTENFRDERWMKFRSKYGHLLEFIDIGSSTEEDLFIRNLNRDDFGAHDGEYGDFSVVEAVCEDPEFSQGLDKRLIRLESRHGNMLWFDDRGSDTTDACKSDPPGVGYLIKTRRGFYTDAIDKDELNRFLISSPKDQIFEINDRFEYVLLTTAQSDDGGTISPGTLKGYAGFAREEDDGIPTGATSDPLNNTHHLVLDKFNEFIRLKTPERAGIEIRDTNASVGTWLEIRDNENRGLWFSKSDQIALWRDGNGMKVILLDDNDNTITLANGSGGIIIQSSGNIDLSAGGDICMEAGGQIGLTAGSVGISTGISHVIDSRGIGTTGDFFGNIVRAKVRIADQAVIAAAISPVVPFPPEPRGQTACTPGGKILPRTQPLDFDQERGNETNKDQKGLVDRTVLNGDDVDPFWSSGDL